jgi:hypothetical protein
VIEKVAEVLVSSGIESDTFNGYLQMIFNMKSDIEVHRKNICDKILEIIQSEYIFYKTNNNRFKKSADSLLEIPWNDSGSRVTIPTNHMSKIIQITKQILRSIEEILDKDDLKGIFTEIVFEVERTFLKVY